MPNTSATDAVSSGSEISTDSRETRKGVLLVLTGTGKGKTTSAIGTALRALGNGFKVAVVQFMKGRIYGELIVLRDRLGVEVWQFGRNAFVDPKNPDPRDLELARQGLDKAWEIVRGGQHDVLILDEIIYVSSYGLLPESEVLELAKARPKWMDLILTGRGASPALTELADTVSEVKEIKHHYKKGIESRAGMEY